MSDTTTITVVAGDGEETLNPVTATVTVIGTVPNGPPGASGSGVPAGGTDGQVLTKQSATDGDADWEDPAGDGGAVDSVDGQTGVVVLSGVYQPLDSDLSAIAALTTTAFGRALLELADAAAGRTAFGLGTAATQASSAFDAAGSAAAAQAASQPLDSDLTAIAALSTTSYGRAFLELADAAAGRTALGLGTAATNATGDFQPVDSDLAAIAALTTTSFGRGLLTLADAAALRSAAGLGTAATSNTGDFDAAGAAAAAQAASQPLDSDLTAIAALSTTSFGRSLLALADAAAAIAALGLDADLATFSVPASTTISSFVAATLDETTVGAFLTALGVDADLATLAVPASTTISSFVAGALDETTIAAFLTALGLDADVATLALPASTTISAFGATLVDDADPSTARTTLGLGTAATTDSPWVDRGVYVAERSLRRWRQTRNPHIVWMGDSTVNGDVGGFDLTNGGAGSPTELLGQMFQGSGPFLGPGFYGLWRDEWVFTAGGAAFTQASATDTWDVGPFFSARKSTGSSTTLATFAIPRTVDPTHADIMFWDDTVTADANWSYATSLDGTTFTAFTNSDQHWVSGLPYVSRQRLALPSGTTHIRVKASNAANTQKDITLLGVMLFTQNPGTGNGVIVSNLGASADLLGTFIRDTDGSPLRTVWALQPTLAIIGPFTNDSPIGFGPLLRKLIAGLRSRTVYDIATTSGSPTVTSATANFTDADRGKNVSGTGLGLGGFTIIDVVNSTTITTSSNATQTNTGVTVSITPNRNKIGQDLVTVNGSRVVDAATGNFMQADVGRVVSATGVPASTRIARVNSSTQVVLTAAATASATVAYLLYDSGTTYPKQVQELEPDILLIGQFNQQLTITRPNVVTTNTSTTVTGPAGTFHANMVNRGFTGTGLNAFTRLASVESDTSATLTIAATASGTITATLAGRTQSDIDDLRAATKAVARGYIGEDGTAVDGDATYTVTGAAFVSHDRGKRVIGWGIPENTFIDTVTNSTTIELSRPAVGDGTGHFEMEGYGYLDMGEVWYDTGAKNAEAGLLWDGFHEAQRGHRELANAVKRLLDTFS